MPRQNIGADSRAVSGQIVERFPVVGLRSCDEALFMAANGIDVRRHDCLEEE